MTMLLLSFLLVGPFMLLAFGVTRRAGQLQLHDRAVAVARLGAWDLADVITYTEDCCAMACMVLARRARAEAALVRQVVGDAVTQVDSVERAARLRRSLGRRRRAHAPRLPAWPDVLLWLAGILDGDVVARLIVWRGERGGADLEAMAERALGRFRAAMSEADEEPFVTLFADELVHLGLLDAKDLEAEHEAGPVTAASERHEDHTL